MSKLLNMTGLKKEKKRKAVPQNDPQNTDVAIVNMNFLTYWSVQR